MSDWQPIETAPEDQWVLVFCPWLDEGKTGGKVWQAINRAGHYGGIGKGWTVHFASFVSRGLAKPPTHWMPFPRPPGDGVGENHEQ